MTDGWKAVSGGEDDLLQLRYVDDEGDLNALNASQVAEALQGVVELASQMSQAGALGDGPAPEVLVRPIAEGSVILEVILVGGVMEAADAAIDYAQGHAAGLTVGGGLAMALMKGIDWGMKTFRSQAKDVEYLDDDMVKVTFQNSTIEIVPKAQFDLFAAKKNKTKSALRKIAAPLSAEADRLELRDGSSMQTTDDVKRTAPDVVIGMDEYRAVVVETDDTTETVRTFTTEAKILGLDFADATKWRMRTTDGTFKVSITDSDFLQRLAAGHPVRQDDVYEVQVTETREEREGRRAKVTREANEIRLIKQGAGDGDGDNAPRARDGA